MSDIFSLDCNRAELAEILEHLMRCESDFTPPLAERVEISAYAQRIFARAVRFEAWEGVRLIGLVAAYCNDPVRRSAFVTSVSVLGEWQGRSIASRLMNACIRYVTEAGFEHLELEVDAQNGRAIRLYEKMGFRPKPATPGVMQLNLKGHPDGQPKEL
jgi:ribosomal protein S18 acetylase RimI-like enzyme